MYIASKKGGPPANSIYNKCLTCGYNVKYSLAKTKDFM